MQPQIISESFYALDSGVLLFCFFLFGKNFISLTASMMYQLCNNDVVTFFLCYYHLELSYLLAFALNELQLLCSIYRPLTMLHRHTQIRRIQSVRNSLFHAKACILTWKHSLWKLSVAGHIGVTKAIWNVSLTKPLHNYLQSLYQTARGLVFGCMRG